MSRLARRKSRRRQSHGIGLHNARERFAGLVCISPSGPRFHPRRMPKKVWASGSQASAVELSGIWWLKVSRPSTLAKTKTKPKTMAKAPRCCVGLADRLACEVLGPNQRAPLALMVVDACKRSRAVLTWLQSDGDPTPNPRRPFLRDCPTDPLIFFFFLIYSLSAPDCQSCSTTEARPPPALAQSGKPLAAGQR